jgi:hypothetical protein
MDGLTFLVVLGALAAVAAISIGAAPASGASRKPDERDLRA